MTRSFLSCTFAVASAIAILLTAGATPAAAQPGGDHSPMVLTVTGTFYPVLKEDVQLLESCRGLSAVPVLKQYPEVAEAPPIACLA